MPKLQAKEWLSRSRKNKRPLRPATLLEPVEVGLCMYEWPGLKVQPSLEKGGAGDGVFATTRLRAGTVIPVLGKRTTIKRGSHLFNGRNGFPRLFPYSDTGCFGLAIAMKVNEPATRKPNCMLKSIGLVVVQDIPLGRELLVHYGFGQRYRRVGYSLDQNKYLHAEYTRMANVRLPTRREMAAVEARYDELLAVCENLAETKALERLQAAGGNKY